jgi:hypothetical protein
VPPPLSVVAHPPDDMRALVQLHQEPHSDVSQYTTVYTWAPARSAPSGHLFSNSSVVEVDEGRSAAYRLAGMRLVAARPEHADGDELNGGCRGTISGAERAEARIWCGGFCLV